MSGVAGVAYGTATLPITVALSVVDYNKYRGEGLTHDQAIGKLGVKIIGSLAGTVAGGTITIIHFKNQEMKHVKFC